MKTAIQTEK